MRLSLFHENSEVLLLGEGNFSFAVTLTQHNLNIKLTATCYENSIIFDSAKRNVEHLKTRGVTVLLGVDATNLELHPTLSQKTFDMIIFNFPHIGGKMKISKNRELLKGFFTSVKSLLKEKGKVYLSLCDGQGGTPADGVRRSWNDSWKVTEMAAHGNFILKATELFDSSLFETYTVIGYRSLEKRFNTKGAITHIFQLNETFDKNNMRPERIINLEKFYTRQDITWNDVIPKLTNSSEDLPLSYFPIFEFDITFILDREQDFCLAKFFEVLFHQSGIVIQDAKLVRSYVFPDLRESKTFRITYRSNKLPLHRKLVIEIHSKIIADIISQNFNVAISG